MTRCELARDDLEIAPRTIDGETIYFVGDPIKIAYHRLDEMQYAVFQKLDGKTSLEDLSKWLNDEHGIEAPPEALAEFIEVLRGLNLLDLSTDTRVDGERGRQIAAKVKRTIAKDGVVFAKRGAAGPSGGLPERRTRANEAKLFDAALVHLDRGEISRCGAKLREILRIAPKNARARYLLRALFSETLGKQEDVDRVMWWRFPIGNPDRLLARIDRAIGKIVFTRAFFAVVAAFFLFGCAVLLSDLDRFVVDVKRFFEFHWIFQDPALPLLMWTLGPLQIFMHECAHGVSCRHYGGRVREMGILVARLSVTAYCDISSTYLLDNKWQRAITCYAGILLDSIVWTFFVLLYHVTDTTSYIGMLAMISIPIKLESMVQGTNPLMRGDGYFALTEIVNYPNLADDARAYVLGKIKEVVTGEQQAMPDGGEAHARMFWIYTVGSLAAFLAVVIPLFIGIVGYLVARLEAVGVLLSLALLYVVFGRIARRALAAAWNDRGVLRRSSRARRVAIGAVAFGVVVLLAPFPITIDATCRVHPDITWLRAPFTGRVLDVEASEDTRVTKGQTIAALDGSALAVTLASERADLEGAQADLDKLIAGASGAELGVSKAELSAAGVELSAATQAVAAARRRARAGGGRDELDAALAAQAAAETRYATAQKAVTLTSSGPAGEAVAAAKAKVEGLKAQVDDGEARLAKAELKAPVDGVVVASTVSLRELPGTRAEAGSSIVGVRRAGGDILEIRIPATEPISLLSLGEGVQARLFGMPDAAVAATITKIAPAVEKATGDDVFEGRSFLRVEATLPDEMQKRALPADLSGTVRITGKRTPLVFHLWLRVVRLYELDLRPLL